MDCEVRDGRGIRLRGVTSLGTEKAVQDILA